MAKEKQDRIATLSKEVNALKRQVGEMTKTLPPRPEDVVARQAMAGERPDYLKVTPGNADYAGPVRQDMERLRGSSRNDLMSDQERGPVSGLGHGTHSRRGRR
jgi:hypothetical protein